MSREIVYALGDVEVVAYTGTAGTSTTTTLITSPGQKGREVRVYATTDCHITLDGTTATTSKTPLAAGTPEYFYRPAGQTISVIQSAAGGNLFITELNY